MPRRDGTGPDGKGALTGRGLGNCGRSSVKIDPKVYSGRPFDGRGQGRGRRPRRGR